MVNADIATSDHLWFTGDKHLLLEIPGENEANYLLLPYRERRLLGLKVMLSHGVRHSGGIAVYKSKNIKLEDLAVLLLGLLREMLEHYDVVNLTIKGYLNNYMTTLLRFLLRYARKESWSRSFKVIVVPLYARVLRLYEAGSFDNVWRGFFNKKVRNAVRKFERQGGVVKRLSSPLDYVKDILRVNLSNPLRQGKPLPPSYTNPSMLVSSLKRLVQDYAGNGKFIVYGAFIKNELVGYAYIVRHGGHAYISRFMVDLSYAKCMVGEGLLSGIIKDLMMDQTEKTRVIQYAYWTPKTYPGIDHFLRQHGFEPGIELALFLHKREIDSYRLMLWLIRMLEQNPVRPPKMLRQVALKVKNVL